MANSEIAAFRLRTDAGTQRTRPQIAEQVQNTTYLLLGSRSFRLFFLDDSNPSSRKGIIRRPDSRSASLCAIIVSGGYVAVDYRPPLVPAIFSTSGRIHSELHSRALHLPPHPRRHPDCDSDYLIRSLLQTFSRTLVTPTTAITPSGSVAANSSSTFAPFARQQWLDVSGLPSVSW